MPERNIRRRAEAMEIAGPLIFKFESHDLAVSAHQTENRCRALLGCSLPLKPAGWVEFPENSCARSCATWSTTSSRLLNQNLMCLVLHVL